MEILLLIMIFILGLCCGSFVNMLIYRVAINYKLESRKFKALPAGRQVKSKNRSFCDYCGRQLKWYENIPVISWLVQRGTTRCCGKKLPVLYPIVEIITGILFLINFQFSIFNFQSNLNSFNFQFLIQLLLGFVIITFLMFSTAFDLKYMILPDFSTVILIVVTIIEIIGRLPESPVQYGISAIISFGFLYFLYLITKKKGMGFGDVKLAFFMGLFLGYPKIIVAMYIAFVVGALFGLILMIFKKAGKKSKISFGPFLILGTTVAWFWGDILIEFLMSNF